MYEAILFKANATRPSPRGFAPLTTIDRVRSVPVMAMSPKRAKGVCMRRIKTKERDKKDVNVLDQQRSK